MNLRSAMKRVRTKETIGNNKKCCNKHDETHLFLNIPLDLLVEIFLKVPARSLARLVFVSKLWSSIIRGKDFTKLYLARSPTRSLLLFEVVNDYMHMEFLKSCPQEDPYFDHQRVNINPHPTNFYAFSPPVRGLIGRQNNTKVVIGNPSTGQFLTLPNVKSRRRYLFSYFGYDPVNDVYKVLCMTVLHGYQRRAPRVVSEEHHVFTLGAKQNWRRIECKHHHLPVSSKKGICINGVVYYYAWIKGEGSLISFDLKSEEFNVNELPEDIPYLVNYNSKIALTCEPQGTLKIWVLEDAHKQEWSKVSLWVPFWSELNRPENFCFRGTDSTGELIFASIWSIKPYYYISFNLKENNAKKIMVKGIGDDFTKFKVYFDHVESPMVL